MRYLSICWSLCLLVTLFQVTSAQTAVSGASGGAYVVSPCLVMPINVTDVPAREPGVLRAIEVREGQRVKPGQLLAQIADDKPQQQKKLAALERDAAQLQSKSDIDTRLAKKAIDLTYVELQQANDARSRVKNSLSLYELRRRQFQWERSQLQAEQADRDHQVAAINALVAEQKVQVADNEIKRRRVEAPYAGVVAKTYPHAGEWVSPGAPVVRLVQMDRLRVEGYINAEDFAPYEVFGKPVTIEVPLPRGKVERFKSKIGYVSPEVEASGEFRVWAEIENRTSPGGFYVIGPGRPATMTLDTETAVGRLPARR